ncbi:hypothetical protein BJ878DRAFT_14401 [Calycina marina]|uniref:Amino acid permease/ SLC12A domain-containing protein n=1 Tax=Calycina marina TaxID=1763456 RepID=A0A9P7Z527_9HELO|nr:hypothetical protein BJ878DRAFT_14401 [Calycina marina]
MYSPMRRNRLPVLDSDRSGTSIYGSSRVLVVMANIGMAPKAFRYVDKKGRPLWCLDLLVTAIIHVRQETMSRGHRVSYFFLLKTHGFSYNGIAFPRVQALQNC